MEDATSTNEQNKTILLNKQLQIRIKIATEIFDSCAPYDLRDKENRTKVYSAIELICKEGLLEHFWARFVEDIHVPLIFIYHEDKLSWVFTLVLPDLYPLLSLCARWQDYLFIGALPGYECRVVCKHNCSEAMCGKYGYCSGKIDCKHDLSKNNIHYMIRTNSPTAFDFVFTDSDHIFWVYNIINDIFESGNLGTVNVHRIEISAFDPELTSIIKVFKLDSSISNSCKNKNNKLNKIKANVMMKLIDCASVTIYHYKLKDNHYSMEVALLNNY